MLVKTIHKEVLMKSDLKVNELQELMNSYYQQSDFKKLLLVVNQLLIKDPNNSEYLTHKLKALEQLGRATENIKFLQHYVNSRSTDITGFLLLYRAYLERDDVVSAIFSLVFALSIEPNNEEVIYLLLDILQDINPEYKRVKINVMTTSRIGHLSCEIEPLFRSLQDQPQDCLYLFLRGGGDIANQYLFGLLEDFSNIIVDSFWINLYISRPLLLNEFFLAEFPYDNNLMLRGVSGDEIFVEGTKNLCHIYNTYPRFLELPSQDIALAWQLLADKNLYKEDKIVCLHVRDSYYLEKNMNRKDYSYHDFRDADIGTYKKAITELISKGYKVVRIGAETNQQLDLDSPSYIDLCIDGINEHRDLVEIVLISLCEFFICTTSGPMSTAALFDTPTLIVNAVPYVHPYFKNSRVIPKRLFQHDKEINIMEVCHGKTLSVNDSKPILLVLTNEELKDNGYQYVDNTELEILNAVNEFMNKVDNRVFDQHLTSQQEEYQKRLPDDFIYKESTSLICDSFLTEYPEIFK